MFKFDYYDTLTSTNIPIHSIQIHHTWVYCVYVKLTSALSKTFPKTWERAFYFYESILNAFGVHIYRMKEEKTIFKPLAGIEPHIFGY